MKEKITMHGIKHPWIWGKGVVAVLLLLTTTGSPQEQTEYANAMLLVSGQQVADHVRDETWRIIDVRSPARYAAGHLPGAINLPLAAITQTINGVPGMLAPTTTVEQALGERGVTRESWVVIYDDFGGVPATRLFWVLDYLGHPRVSILQGGLRLWEQEGRPLTREVPQPQPSRYQAAPDATKLADRTWVQAHLQDSGTVLLDARSPKEFTGEVAGRQIGRPGRIPGAVNVNWVRNLTPPPPRFKAAADLRHLYQGVGVTPEKEIVVYCRTGMRASHDYFVLRLLGYPRVRVYDGSFVEWSADATLPVEQGAM
jgi:thiosulfate/3-mercaptopyruvate sulfurtransferase